MKQQTTGKFGKRHQQHTKAALTPSLLFSTQSRCHHRRYCSKVFPFDLAVLLFSFFFFFPSSELSTSFLYLAARWNCSSQASCFFPKYNPTFIASASESPHPNQLKIDLTETKLIYLNENPCGSSRTIMGSTAVLYLLQSCSTASTHESSNTKQQQQKNLKKQKNRRK
jgi:hypothetical protein